MENKELTSNAAQNLGVPRSWLRAYRPLQSALETFVYRAKIRFLITVITGLLIRRTEYRFDSTWRHADTGYKAAFYRVCCTFAANYIADDAQPFGWHQVKHWARYL